MNFKKKINYLIHIFLKILKEPSALLNFENYLIKIRFHLWPFIPRSKKRMISLYGSKILIEDNTLNGRGFYSYREYKDKNEKDLIDDQIPKNSICIDVGSNIGFYTIFLLKKKNCKKSLFI